MARNLYELMLGDPTEERMRTAADLLRGQQARADLAMLTGDPVLTQYGQRLGQRTQAQAGGLAKTRAAMGKRGPLAQKIADFSGAMGRPPSEDEVMRMASAGVTIQQAPTGYQSAPGGGLEPVPGGPADPSLPGVVEARQSRANARTMQAGLESAQLLKELVKKHGTEMVGPKSREMAALYGSMVTSLGAARGMGVLQPGEIAMLQSQFIDPSSIGAAFRFNETVKAGIDAYIAEMERALKRLPEEAGVEVPKAPTPEESAEGAVAGRRGQLIEEARKRGLTP